MNGMEWAVDNVLGRLYLLWRSADLQVGVIFCRVAIFRSNPWVFTYVLLTPVSADAAWDGA